MIALKDTIYDRLKPLLAEAKGKANAITIDQLAMRLDLTKTHPVTGVPVPDRRPVETALQKHWGAFPFLLVSGSPGIWIPAGADEINSFIHNIRSRHVSLREKDNETCRKARALGFPEQDGRFVDPAEVTQTEMFA